MRFLLITLLLAGCLPNYSDDDDDATDDLPPDWDNSAIPEADEPARSPLAGTVNFVIDGDTFDITFTTGGTDRVRVLAIDTPELNHDEPWPAECWAEEAKDAAQDLLPGDTPVWLTFDGEEQDDFGRLLAYVWIGYAPADVSFQDSFNYQMVRNGHANTFFFDNNRSFEDILRAGEQQAASEDLGVWSCD